MAIKLTPDVYSQNATWSRQGRNKATSVTMQPLSITTQEGEIASVSYSTSALLKQTSRVYSSNTRYLTFADRQLAKGTVALSSADMSVEVNAEKASTGEVTGYITFTGATYEVARGNSTYEAYPTFDEMQGSLDSLAAWIRDPNQSGSTKIEAISILDLSQTDLLVAPWVRNNITGTDTQAADVFTDWYKDDGYAPPAYDSWKTYGQYVGNTGIVDITMFPPDIWSGEPQHAGPSRLSTEGLTFTSRVKVTRTGDRTFEVSWRAPTRILYMCASRSFGFTYHEVDNYAFLIDVDSITVHLHSTAYESEYKTYTSGSGRDLLKIDRTQLLHDNTMINLGSSYIRVWHRELADHLKTRLSEGLIAATCTVPAEWAIRNNITIDSTISIVLQDGTSLSRVTPSGESRVLDFRVVRITKRFSASEFVYEINLMEVPYVELAK